MADLATLKALRDRVAEATGPDRDLDADICITLQYDPGSARPLEGQTLFRVYPMPHTVLAWSDDGFPEFIAPSLTASVDTAVALVERMLPGWWRTSGTWPGMEPQARGVGRVSPPGEMTGITLFAYTEPLAIVFALLSALIAQTEEAR